MYVCGIGCVCVCDSVRMCVIVCVCVCDSVCDSMCMVNVACVCKLCVVYMCICGCDVVYTYGWVGVCVWVSVGVVCMSMYVPHTTTLPTSSITRKYTLGACAVYRCCINEQSCVLCVSVCFIVCCLVFVIVCIVVCLLFCCNVLAVCDLL